MAGVGFNAGAFEFRRRMNTNQNNVTGRAREGPTARDEEAEARGNYMAEEEIGGLEEQFLHVIEEELENEE